MAFVRLLLTLVLLAACEAGTAGSPASGSAPGAKTEHGIPIYPHEMEELDRRAHDSDRIGRVILGYGQYRDDWGGLITEGGMVVGLFTGNVDAHRAALRERLGPVAAFDVRQVRWALTDLNALADRIDADRAWFLTLGAELVGAGSDETENRVVVRVWTDRSDIERLVQERYGGGDQVAVRSSGVAPWNGGSGDLIVTVTDADGRPVNDGACVVSAPDPAARLRREERGVLDGRCKFRGLPATRVEVVLEEERVALVARWVHLAADDVTRIDLQLPGS